MRTWYLTGTRQKSGTQSKTVGGVASDPASFMQLWDAACGTISSTGVRRGAMMATLRCDHPDIEEFVTAKQQLGQLRRFNLSVLVTDPFMAAVRNDTDWPLLFPASAIAGSGQIIECERPGSEKPVPCIVDRINKLNNLWY